MCSRVSSPVIPTSSRVFTRRDTPQAFVRIYQGGDGALAPASIRVTLHDRADFMVFNNRFPAARRSFRRGLSIG